ncbi:hypothetical protein HH308_11160 [Gordonia sp. TBRC 11910]|uniref:Uncharacterized protein n=1 Tax=Gordonia asplenii TaxID=2725283 RepID=A0A848KU20_9ACTN|nr:hypothetical protein [Gordonia asplenii]NMO01772.1 hypothetical protein [Gordonia asplenii]
MKRLVGGVMFASGIISFGVAMGGIANADVVGCGILTVANRTGTVYINAGDATCAQARATIQRGITGPTRTTGASGGQVFDYNGTQWNVWDSGPGGPDRIYRVWSDTTGVKLAWM